MVKTSFKLQVNEIYYSHSQEPLIQNAVLELQPNLVYGLMGESGIGKTSLWESLINYPKKHLQYSFEILKNGESWPHEGQIALLPQQPGYTLNPTIKVRTSIRDILRSVPKSRASTMEQIVKKASLNEEHLNKYPHELSGGELQRVAFAMAIAMDCSWLILDEPTSSLDKLTASEVLETAQNWSIDGNRICIISSHDGQLLSKYCDRIIFLKNRQFEGPVKPALVKDILNISFPDFKELRSHSNNGKDLLVKVENGKFQYKSKGYSFRLDVGIEIPNNSIKGISGRSGSGKSTLGRLIAGFLKWDSGNVRMKGTIEPKTDIQYIPQDPVSNFHPYQSIDQQLWPVYKKWHPGNQRSDLFEFLHQFQIPAEWLDHSILELSGGQRQRLLLARSLIAEPALLILDETFSALDHSSVTELLEWLNHVHLLTGVSILLISHDIRMLLAFCNKVHIMSDGRLIDHIVPEKDENNIYSPVTKALLRSYY